MRSLLLASVAVTTLAGLASATVVMRLDLPQVVQRSDVVMEGRVLSTRVEQDGRGLLFTTVTLSVDQGHRGSRAGDVFTFRMPGGELNGKRTHIPGLPRLQPGEDVFLFLTKTSSRGFRVPVGLGQGTYRLTRDASGARRLNRSLVGLELVDGTTGKPVSLPEQQVQAYEAFREEVERLIGSGR